MRIKYIDIAKGIAILTVVLGHLGIIYSWTYYPGGVPETLTTFIFTFHMPLFFLVSGYFFKAPEGLNLKFIKRDAKSLLIPYYVTAVIVVLLALVKGVMLGFGTPELIQVAKDWIKASLYAMGSISAPAAPEGIPQIGAIWFLWGLFWARFFLALTINRRFTPLYLILLFGLGTLSAQYFWLPLSIQSGMTAALFLWVGMECKAHQVFTRFKAPRPLLIFALLMWAFVVFDGAGVAPVIASYPLGMLSVAIGIVGSWFSVKLSQLIEAKSAALTRFLEWLGRNTLPIFCMHLVEDNLAIHDFLNLIESHAPFLEAWPVVFVLRMGMIGLMCAVLWIIPPLKRIYFPHIKKKAKAVPAAS